MTSSWQGEERREHPRVPLEGDVRGKIQTLLEAPVVDISLSGALVEVPTTLPIRARYLLRLPKAGGEGTLELRGEVMRSYVHGFDKDAQGQPSVRYRAALHFVDATEAQKRALQRLIKEAGEHPLTGELSR